MAFVENLDAFFGDFGLPAIVDGATVDGIFDNQFATALGFTAGAAPILVCKTEDVSTVEQEAPVTIGSTGYTVTGVEPDGTGLTLLRLSKT